MAFVSHYNAEMHIIEEEGDELFLDLIKTRPWLYDKGCNAYGDKIMTQNAWMDISKIINEPVEECVKRWNRIKNNFHKEKMLREKETRSGSGQSNRKSWPLYERMKHLFESEHRVRKTYSNISVHEVKKTFKPPSKTKKVKNKPNFMDSVLNTFSENTDRILSKLPSNEASSSSDLSTKDQNEIFGYLVAVELDNMDEETSSKKRKLLYKYISEI